MIIITGASDNHYKTLIQFLNSFIKFYPNNTFSDTETISIVVYNLGITEDKWRELMNQFTQSHIIYKVFDYSKYPAYLNININAGEYAWKPVCLYNTCQEYNDEIIMWMDSGTIIIKKLDKLHNYILKNGIYSEHSSGDIKKWTHPKTLEYMKCDPNLYTKQNRAGGYMGYNYKLVWVKEFVKELYNLALTKECIAPEGSSRHNHRQDQAVFNILFYQYQNKYMFNDEIDNDRCYTLHNDID